jgi:flagellar assembly protein FliH
MMTSPSEDVGLLEPQELGGAKTPVRLLRHGGREVSRLEFYPIGGREPVVAEGEPEGAEELPDEEVAELRGKLQSQAEEMSAAMEGARNEAKAEACREWAEELEERVVKERVLVLTACEEFRKERIKYFAGVEAEVVKLALGIAARVLHREVKLDPLLLAGVVRVVLEKVAEGSTVVVRVPEDEADRWREVLADGQGRSLELMGDERLHGGDCVIDTSVGRVELGVNAQLAEIERGFFDLLQQRPM